VSKLPKGWGIIELDKAALLIRGVSYKKNESNLVYQKGCLPILRANNIQNGQLVLDNFVYIPSEKIKEAQYIKTGDIVIAMSSGSKNLVGKSGVAKNDFNGAFGTFCGLLRPNKILDKSYVAWFTRSKDYLDKVSSLSKGVNINNIKPSHFNEIFIPIAPLNEQKRIADKLDSIFAKVDKAQAGLEKIPSILKRFRQSVLAAATSGELTKDWREFKKIERELKLYTVDQISKDEKYSLGIGPFGSDLKVVDYRDKGHPLVFVREIRSRLFGHVKTQFVDSDKFCKLKAHRVKPGNLLITKMGDPPGDVAIYPEDMPEAVITSDCIKLDVNEQLINRDFAFYYLQSEHFQSQVKSITAGVAQQKVNLKNFKSLELLIPSKEEQDKVVQRIESMFSMAYEAEKQYIEAKARIDRLTQSILAKAFRGELVAQDPNDETAEQLLAKIKAAMPLKPSAKKRSKR
jgi:type I restriction enzyme S subunit